jgi:hypothetical protein
MTFGFVTTARLVIVAVCAGLVGCADTAGQGGAAPLVGSASSSAAPAAAKRTLAEFCKSPPKTTKPFSPESIAVSCTPRVLAKAGTSEISDMPSGVYAVRFATPVLRKSICDDAAPKASICGFFLPDDTMNTSRIVAP